MKTTNGVAVWKDSLKDTRLRSGAVRLVDLRGRAVLDFTSSLEVGYSVDNIGNAVIAMSGLNNPAVEHQRATAQNTARLVVIGEAQLAALGCPAPGDDWTAGETPGKRDPPVSPLRQRKKIGGGAPFCRL